MTGDAGERPRSTYLGGSDAAAACGIDPYRSSVDLWLVKTGRKEADDLSENQAVRWGTLLEPVVRREYAAQTGFAVEPGRFLLHPGFQWLAANVDGFATPAGQPRRVLEIKTAGLRQSHLWGEPGSDAVPMPYVVQVMHYLLVSNLDVADVAVLVGGQDFRVYTVERDPDVIEWMIEREAAFWDCVTSGKPPDERRVGDAAKLFPQSFKRPVVASGAIRQVVEDLRAIDVAAKRLDERRDGLAESIQSFMEDADELVDADGVSLATWRTVKTERVDVKQLEKDNPHVADLYRRSSSYRRFLVKKDKDQ